MAYGQNASSCDALIDASNSSLDPMRMALLFSGLICIPSCFALSYNSLLVNVLSSSACPATRSMSSAHRRLVTVLPPILTDPSNPSKVRFPLWYIQDRCQRGWVTTNSPVWLQHMNKTNRWPHLPSKLRSWMIRRGLRLHLQFLWDNNPTSAIV